MGYRQLARALVSLSVALSLIFAPFPVAAFKIDTHVWIAQQIIVQLEESPEGLVSFNLADGPVTFEVDDRVRSAIIQNPEMYMLGSMGPDAFPGVYEGQMAIHPGNEASWGTGDWLEHVVSSAESDAEIAFAYGMLAHAAGDIWAHTYVNQYAGNAFALVDGEIDVETRHYLLEGYISKRMPAFVRRGGLGVPTAWDLLRGNGKINLPSDVPTATDLLRRNGELNVPVDFLYRVFVADQKAASEFAQNGAPFFLAVHNLNETLEHLARDGGPTDDIHHLIQGSIIYALTEYTVSQDELEWLNARHQEYLDLEDEAVDGMLDAMDELRAIPDGLSDSEEAEIDRGLSKLTDLVGEIQGMQSRKNDLEDEILALDQRLRRLIDPTERVCRQVRRSCPPLSPSCEAVRRICEDRTIPHPDRDMLERAVREKRNLESDLSSRIQGKLGESRQLIADAFQFVRNVRETEAAVFRGIVELGQRFKENENPIKSALRAWRDDNEAATKGYFMANGVAMTNVLEGESMLDPLTNWVKCEALVYTSFPSEVLEPSCEVLDRVKELQELLDQVKNLDPLSAELNSIIDGIREDALDAAKAEGLDVSSEILGVAINEFAAALSTEATAENLNGQFLAAPDGIQLLRIERLSEYVDRDMRLDAGGHLSPSEFPPLVNALTLTRLSLLSPDQLNSLTGGSWYSPSESARGNIMYRFASNIDGNHQWLATPPPYPRADGDHEDPERDTYGYPGELPMWDSRQRDRVFRSLFIGPLNGAFVDVGDPAMPHIDVPEYNYIPTPDCAFPDYDRETGSDNCGFN